MKKPKPLYNTQEPLYNTQAETALIGAAFLNPETFCNTVNASDFGTIGFGKLWLACQELARKDVTPDLISLPPDIFPVNKNPLYFTNACPSVSNAAGYAAIVKHWSRRRRLESAASLFAQAAFEEDTDRHIELLQLAYELLREAEHGDGWQVLSLVDAYAPRDPVQYAVEGLFEIPSLNIVYGAPGTLKSMLLADLCVCIAGGLDWLPEIVKVVKQEDSNEPDTTDVKSLDFLSDVSVEIPVPSRAKTVEPKTTTQATTFWIDFDNGRRRTDERMEALARSRGLPEDAPFYYVVMPSPWLDGSDDGSIDGLIWQIKTLEAKVVVVDNLRVVSGRGDENSAEMSSVMTGFRRVAEETGTAVILIHHQRKGGSEKGRLGDSLRGHSSIEASIDLAILVHREPEDGDTLVLQSTKTRGVDVKPFGAQFYFQHRPNTKEMADAFFVGVPIETKTGKTNEAIREIVEREQPINQSTLIQSVKELLPEVGKHYIRDSITWMADNELLTVKEGPKNAKLYELPY